jgi:hypothetical protein
MKYQMSVQHSEGITYGIVGVMTGFLQYFNNIPLNIHLFSQEWVITSLHAGITGAFCGGMGWLGKKITEWGISAFKDYLQERKHKKQLKQKPRK